MPFSSITITVAHITVAHITKAALGSEWPFIIIVTGITIHVGRVHRWLEACFSE